MGDALEIIGAAGEATVLMVTPFPRYVAGKCCDDPSHITNYGSDEYFSEMYRVGDYVESAVASVGTDANIIVFHMLENLVGNDSDLTELRTAGGGTVWRTDDPVHLTSDAYSDIAAAIALSGAGDPDVRAAKRPRLCSVVPPSREFRGKKTNVKPPSWVAGLAARGRGRYEAGPSYRGYTPRGRGLRFARGRGGGRRGGFYQHNY
jgi:hypothetical protein